MAFNPLTQTTELSPRERTVLWLYGGEGMSTKQVAAEMGITVETVKSFLKRLRVKLRARETPVPADSRLDLFMAALSECADLGPCLAARDQLQRLLAADDEEPLAVAA